MTKTSGNFTDFVDFSRASSGTALRRIAYGSELVTNGTFDTDVSGWTGDGTVAYDGGTLSLTSVGTQYAEPDSAISTVSGSVYKVTFDLSNTASNVNFRVGTTSKGVDILNASWGLSDGSHEYSFVATGTTTYIAFGVADDQINIDNVSVKEVLFDDPSGDLVLFNHPDNISRVEYDASGNVKGLLIEEARTNIMPRSEVIVGNGWSDSGSTSTDLSENALDLFNGVSVQSGGANWNRISNTQSTVTSGTEYAATVFYRAGTSGRLRVVFRDGGAATETIITGEIGSLAVTLSDAGSASVLSEESLAGDVKKLTISFTPNFSGTLNFGIGPDSNTSGETVIAYAGQIEVGSFATSYIPTAGSTAARSVDIASIDVDQFGYNKTAGTMLVEYNYVALDSGVLGRFLELNGTSASTERILLYQAEGSENTYFQIRDDGVTSVGLSTPDFTFDQDAKVAASYSSKSAILYSDGDLSGADTSVVVPDDITKLDIGRADSSGTDLGKVYIKSVKYYPRRLTDAQLEKLTKPAASTTLSLTFDGQDGSSLTTGLHP